MSETKDYLQILVIYLNLDCNSPSVIASHDTSPYIGEAKACADHNDSQPKTKLRPAPKKGRDAVFFRIELSATSLMCKEEHCNKQGGYDPCADFNLLYFAAECFDYYI